MNGAAEQTQQPDRTLDPLALAHARYARLLVAHVEAPSEEWLAEAAEIGRELVTAGVPHEDMLEIHDEALDLLCQTHPELLLSQAARLATEPLMELQMAYGLVHRRQLEQSRRLNRMLAQEVEERRRAERDLEQKARELERSNHDLLHFAAVASHDLQAPLRSIAGFIGLLNDPEAEIGEEQRRRLLETVASSAARMQRLIADLLAWARVGATELLLEPVDLDAMLGLVAQDLRGAIDEAGAAVTWDSLPVVRASRSLLPHVLQNLVGNGLKFHGDAPPRVHVSAHRDGDRWVVSVRDNGIGIEPRFQRQIFEPFKRLHAEARYPGTGLGLAVCARIVERHGERLWVTSEPGHGSCFSFTCLPVE